MIVRSNSQRWGPSKLFPCSCGPPSPRLASMYALTSNNSPGLAVSPLVIYKTDSRVIFAGCLETGFLYLVAFWGSLDLSRRLCLHKAEHFPACLRCRSLMCWEIDAFVQEPSQTIAQTSPQKQMPFCHYFLPDLYSNTNTFPSSIKHCSVEAPSCSHPISERNQGGGSQHH